MVGGEAGPERPRSIRVGRLEAFSDGVFAIAITLLVLELSVPAGSEDDLLRAFLDQWRSYLAYLSSFATIGLVWLAHSAITDLLDQADALLVRLNLVLLMVVSFLPFPTRLLAEYGGDDDAGRVATTIYGLTLLAVAVLLGLLWRYALRAGLVRAGVAAEELLGITQRLTPGLAGYLAMLLLGLLAPFVAVAGYLVLAVVLLVPFGIMRTRHWR